MSKDKRTAKLTSRTIGAAKPAAKRYVIWDTEKKGFGVRVETSGLKSFIVRYRANGGGRNAWWYNLLPRFILFVQIIGDSINPGLHCAITNHNR